MQFLFQFNTWPLVTIWWPSQSAVLRGWFFSEHPVMFFFSRAYTSWTFGIGSIGKNIPPQAQPGNFNVWTGAVFHQVKFELVASTRLKHIRQFESFPQGSVWRSQNIWNHHLDMQSVMRVLEYLMRQYLPLGSDESGNPRLNSALNGKTHRFVGIL